MIIKLKKKNVVFRNTQLFAPDIKSVNLERVLSNLFLLIATNGVPVNFKTKGIITIETLKGWIKNLEDAGYIKGVTDEKGEIVEAVEDWIRSNLVDLVYRGNVVKENVASLRPMHLMSYRIQNRKFNRDYNTSDQLYIMLRQHPEVMNGLKSYLGRGWDANANTITNADLDVDTMCILLLTSNIAEKKKPNTEVNNDKPILERQTALFADDIRRLLVYADLLPRNVFIDYLRILIGLHLGLYILKLSYLLPKMREAGSTNVTDDWSMVVDLTDRLDSQVSSIACEDMEKLINGLQRYFHVTFEINAILAKYKNLGQSRSIDQVLEELVNIDKSDQWYNWEINSILSAAEPEDIIAINEKLKYFPENDYFDRFIHLLEMTSGGSVYQFKYHKDFIDRVTMKNSDSKLLADGRRSRSHPRRGAMGSKLLETLVQLLVLEPTADGKYTSRSFSIDELAKLIRERYGLIINGAGEKRFADASVNTHAAFRENMEAFKDKLRQIGFYTDLSDACLLQKIRPRYNI